MSRNNFSIYRRILIGITFGVISYLVTRKVLTRKLTKVVIIEKSEATPEEQIPQEPVEESQILIEDVPVDAQEKKDDLKLIIGIGPKIETVLNAAGIATFNDLSDISSDKFNEILKSSGIRLFKADTWQEQARLAKEGKWDLLKSFSKGVTE